jgi:hypothetical protein
LNGRPLTAAYIETGAAIREEPLHFPNVDKGCHLGKTRPKELEWGRFHVVGYSLCAV